VDDTIAGLMSVYRKAQTRAIEAEMLLPNGVTTVLLEGVLMRILCGQLAF